MKPFKDLFSLPTFNSPLTSEAVAVLMKETKNTSVCCLMLGFCACLRVVNGAKNINLAGGFKQKS